MACKLLRMATDQRRSPDPARAGRGGLHRRRPGWDAECRITCVKANPARLGRVDLESPWVQACAEGEGQRWASSKPSAELARLRGDDAARERALRKAHRSFAEMGATGHAERLAKELGL